MATIEDGSPAVEDTTTLGRRIPLSPRARALLASVGTPAALLARLLEERWHVDAIPVQASVMPVRRAVWWGTLCAWHAAGGQLPGEQDRALGAAVRWVVQPTREAGKACAAAADVATLDNPAGCCARAAAFVGAQTAPGGPLVVGQPILAAKLIASAVVFAFARTHERDRTITYEHFLELGREVAAGALHWEPLPA